MKGCPPPTHTPRYVLTVRYSRSNFNKCAINKPQGQSLGWHSWKGKWTALWTDILSSRWEPRVMRFLWIQSQNHEFKADDFKWRWDYYQINYTGRSAEESFIQSNVWWWARGGTAFNQPDQIQCRPQESMLLYWHPLSWGARANMWIFHPFD